MKKKSKPEKLVAYIVVCGDGKAHRSLSSSFLSALEFSTTWLSPLCDFPDSCGPHKVVELVEKARNKK